MSSFRLIAAAGAVLAFVGFGLPLRAAERVTLSNGFDLVCDHRQAIGDRVRLYTGTADFVEVDASQIVSVEQVPDQPRVRKEQTTAVPAITERELGQLMAAAGVRHNIDVDLLASVVRAESGGRTTAVSRTGAQGLMQLMPHTATEMGVVDSFRPDQNIDGGTAYLDGLLSRYHDNLALALAAYNAGPAAVDKYHGIPPYRETQAYVARVIREFNARKRAAAVRLKTAARPSTSRDTAQIAAVSAN